MRSAEAEAGGSFRAETGSTEARSGMVKLRRAHQPEGSGLSDSRTQLCGSFELGKLVFLLRGKQIDGLIMELGSGVARLAAERLNFDRKLADGGGVRTGGLHQVPQRGGLGAHLLKGGSHAFPLLGAELLETGHLGIGERQIRLDLIKPGRRPVAVPMRLGKQGGSEHAQGKKCFHFF